jgi:hypothetical protein
MVLLFPFPALALGLGCNDTSPSPAHQELERETPYRKPGLREARRAEGPIEETDYKRSQLGKGVWLETKGDKRRVVVEATVCLREGAYGLECFLCRTGTKEHESVLHTDADAKVIHAGLLAAGAIPGSPVQYKEAGKEIITIPPSGQSIRVIVEYEERGRRVRVPAQEWVRNTQSKTAMKGEWVFAGSRLWKNEQTGATVYSASAEGGYICTSNVPTALLDVPFDSPKSLEGRSFEPFTEHIPPLDTKVMIILEPNQVATPATGRAHPN